LIELVHGIKGFVRPTKSFVKIGIAEIFCYNKMFSSINKTFGCYSKNFGCSNKKKFVVPNFVVVTKPFFPCTNLTIPVPKISDYESLFYFFFPFFSIFNVKFVCYSLKLIRPLKKYFFMICRSCSVG